jgi:hypothetical protein
MASTHLRSFKNQLIKTVVRENVQIRDTAKTAQNKVLLKHWYAKDRWKVPESCEKNDLVGSRAYPRPCFLLSVFPGT